MQNNLVMKIKKVAALAGSAIMASSMMAPVMAATLAGIPAPFIANGVFNANIVVGSSGTAAGISSDLAGAMDVAAAFAQKASATVSSSGSISLTRPMTPGALNSSSGYLGIGDSLNSKTFNSSMDGFEWLNNETVSYNDTNYGVWDLLSVGPNAKLDTNGKYTDFGGNLVYNVTQNGSAMLPKGVIISIFGKPYQLIDVKADGNATFGQMTENKGLVFPSTVTIPGKASVEVLDFSTTGNQDVLVKVTAANGTVLFNDFMSNAGTKEYSDDGYLFTLSNLRTLSSGASTIDLSWSTSAIELANNQNAMYFDSSLANWKVLISSNNTLDQLSYIAFKTPSFPNLLTLNEGQNTEIMEYFNISFNGWRDLNTTALTINSIGSFTDGLGGSIAFAYTGNESNDIAVSFNGIKGVTSVSNVNKTSLIKLLSEQDVYYFDFNSSSSVIVLDSEGNQVGILPALNQSADVNVASTTLFNTSNAWYNITYTNASAGRTQTNFNISLINWTAQNGTLFGQTSKFTNYSAQYVGTGKIVFVSTTNGQEFNTNGTLSGTLTITESDTNTIVVTYLHNNIDSVNAAGTSVASGDSIYTPWGSMVSRASNVNIVYPETRRYANIWIGRSAIETTLVSVGDEIDGSGWTVAGSSVASAGGVTPIVPGIGASASAYSSPVSLVKPTIIIGGGEANSLTAELAANEEGVTTATLLEATNKAYLELIENAFGGSQTVLVIAGRDAKDTKLACQALAAHVAGTRALTLSGNLVWLDTSASSYTSVTVVAE